MKKILLFASIAFAFLAFLALRPAEDATVASPSVQLFTPLTAVDSVTAQYLTWTNNSLKTGTVTWLIDVSKAVTDSAKTTVITIEQSAQTAPLMGVSQRWYTTDTIAVLSGKVATPQLWYKDSYTHAMAGREVRLKLVSTDDHALTTGKFDMIFRPDF